MDNIKTAMKREREKKVVSVMIALYCRKQHKSSGNILCPECSELTAYALARAEHCPHMETKTFCSNCKTHCYKPEMRQRIRRVMRYSGPRIVFSHPVMAIRHVIETIKEKRKLSCV